MMHIDFFLRSALLFTFVSMKLESDLETNQLYVVVSPGDSLTNSLADDEHI